MKRILPILFLFIFFCTYCKAEITLPAIFSNNMVLQRDSNTLLYGWALPNEEFKIYTSWNKVTITVKAGNDAKWQTSVTTPVAGPRAYQIIFTGEENEIVLTNVIMGDVWLCSGQSNMEWSANSGIENKEKEISEANYPNIRLFTVQKRTADYPQENVSGKWEVCSSKTIPDFSAVAYFFARKVTKETGIPIGLIDASWGASCAEVWTPESVFKENPKLEQAHRLVKANPWVTNQKSSLYNAMIAPLVKFKITGVLWYQGESNTANAETYEELFCNMISSWRTKWGYDYPFYFVQIAPFNYGRPYEGGVVRDQQRRTLQLENTGMAMTSDICTVKDIHPQNKQDVGLRLANIALKQHYNIVKQEVYGPLFSTYRINGDTVTVIFDHAEGLHAKGKSLDYFEVANQEGEWFSANARIKNGEVLVHSKKVKYPIAVRLGWASTAIVNLFNSANLPASTFTSDCN